MMRKVELPSAVFLPKAELCGDSVFIDDVHIGSAFLDLDGYGSRPVFPELAEGLSAGILGHVRGM